jgi:hypothetical protein
VTSQTLSRSCFDIDHSGSISYPELSEGLTSIVPDIYLSLENMRDIMTNLDISQVKDSQQPEDSESQRSRDSEAFESRRKFQLKDLANFTTDDFVLTHSDFRGLCTSNLKEYLLCQSNNEVCGAADTASLFYLAKYFMLQLSENSLAVKALR